ADVPVAGVLSLRHLQAVVEEFAPPPQVHGPAVPPRLLEPQHPGEEVNRVLRPRAQDLDMGQLRQQLLRHLVLPRRRRQHPSRRWYPRRAGMAMTRDDCWPRWECWRRP